MIRSSTAPNGRRGITLIEVLIALTLLGLVLGNIYMVMGRSAKTYSTETGNSVVEAHARRTLDRVALALVGASRSTLYDAKEAPFSSSEMNYQTCLGIESGEMVWSNPQKIALVTQGARQVAWFEDPGLPDERRVAWSNWVAEWLAGESQNGLDDNANGLRDEKGLSFDIDGDSVIIRLTIEKPSKEGPPIRQTLQSRVTCRN